MIWHLRYWRACLWGAWLRFTGQAPAESRTLAELVSGYERYPTMRARLAAARKRARRAE